MIVFIRYWLEIIVLTARPKKYALGRVELGNDDRLAFSYLEKKPRLNGVLLNINQYNVIFYMAVLTLIYPL